MRPEINTRILQKAGGDMGLRSGSYHPNVLGPDQVDYEIGAYFDELERRPENLNRWVPIG